MATTSYGKALEDLIESGFDDTIQSRRKEASTEEELERFSMTPVLREPNDGDKHIADILGIEEGKLPGPNFPVRVYETTYWPEELRAHIPDPVDGWEWDVRHAYQLFLAYDAAEPSFLWGPTGSGKTMSVFQLAAVCNVPIFRVAGHQYFDPVLDAFAQIMVKDGSTIALDGPATLAMKYGAIFLKDEVSASPAGSNMALFPVFEKASKLVVPGKLGDISERTVHTNSTFWPVATDNTNLGGDVTGRYSGTNVQNQALANRMKHKIWVGYPTSKITGQVLKNIVPSLPETLSDAMIQTADLIRSDYSQGRLQTTMSTRNLIFWAEETARTGSPMMGLAHTYYAGLTETDRTLCFEIVARIFGHTIAEGLNKQ